MTSINHSRSRTITGVVASILFLVLIAGYAYVSNIQLPYDRTTEVPSHHERVLLSGWTNDQMKLHVIATFQMGTEEEEFVNHFTHVLQREFVKALAQYNYVDKFKGSDSYAGSIYTMHEIEKFTRQIITHILKDYGEVELITINAYVPSITIDVTNQ